MTMIEKVAAKMFERRRVLYPVTHRAIFGGPMSFEEVQTAIFEGRIVASALADILADARAAIEAMREPSDSLIGEYRFPAAPYPDQPDANQVWDVGLRQGRAFWHAMIDAALAEKP